MKKEKVHKKLKLGLQTNLLNKNSFINDFLKTLLFNIVINLM